MADYKSNPVTLHKSAEDIYGKLTNLGALKDAMPSISSDQIPEDKRKMLEGITIENDSITIPGGPTGAITLRKAACTPFSLVSYEGVGTPVPVTLSAHIQSAGTDACEVTVEASIQVPVPVMLKPMLNGPMSKMVNEISSQLSALQLN